MENVTPTDKKNIETNSQWIKRMIKSYSLTPTAPKKNEKYQYVYDGDEPIPPSLVNLIRNRNCIN